MAGRRTYLMFIVAPPAILSLTAFGGFINGGLPASFAPWPFLIGLLVSGLPHGAVDLRISQQLGGESGSQSVTGFLWYVAIMFAAAGGLFLTPRLMLLCFGLLTVWHFGRADERDLTDAGQGTHRLPAYRCLWSVARGSTILLLPFWFAPEQTLDVVSGLLKFCGDGRALALPHLSTVTTALLTFSLAVQVHSVIQRWRGGQNLVALQESVELLALWAAFASLHPLFAMGLYFLTWHSWRHLRRLNPVLNGRSVWDVRLSGLLKVHVDALILLVPTLTAVIALTMWRTGAPDATSLTLTSLLVYVVVTLPHEIMCSRLFSNAESSGKEQPLLMGSSVPVSNALIRLTTNVPQRFPKLLHSPQEAAKGARQSQSPVC